MFKTTLGLAALIATAVAGNAIAADLPVKAPKAAPPPPPIFFVNENSVSYSYAFTATNPGAGSTPKHVLNFTHFDVWAYGTNFFTVDWLKATNGNAPPFGTPAAPCDSGLQGGDPNGCAGYTEIYGLFRSTLGWNQLFNTKAFVVGPLTNVEFVVGSDMNTDNTTLGSAKRSYQGGLQFDFATPYHGFFNVSFNAYKEFQNDGFAALFGPNFSGKVEFDTTWGIEALYVQPLGFLPPSIPLTFKSLEVLHGPKGNGEIGAAQRVNEYLTQQTLSLDVGKMVTGRSDLFSIWTSYRWWKNKFGLSDIATPGGHNGINESTWITGATFAF
jgi:hypothetical protein